MPPPAFHGLAHGPCHLVFPSSPIDLTPKSPSSRGTLLPPVNNLLHSVVRPQESPHLSPKATALPRHDHRRPTGLFPQSPPAMLCCPRGSTLSSSMVIQEYLTNVTAFPPRTFVKAIPLTTVDFNLKTSTYFAGWISRPSSWTLGTTLVTLLLRPLIMIAISIMSTSTITTFSSSRSSSSPISPEALQFGQTSSFVHDHLI